MRKRIIEALWHSAEPLSARRFHSEYVDPEEVTLERVTYHVRQLEKDKIIRLEGADQSERYERRCFVLDGPHGSQAVHRLELTQG
jgi:Fe2+ or Zn2+ uptake regulation protein